MAPRNKLNRELTEYKMDELGRDINTLKEGQVRIDSNLEKINSHIQSCDARLDAQELAIAQTDTKVGWISAGTWGGMVALVLTLGGIVWSYLTSSK